MKSMLKESEMSVKNILPDIFPETLPWILEKPEVILKLNELPKIKNLSQHLYRKKSSYSIDYPEHLHVFTDGSKDHSTTACAAVRNEIIHKKALLMESSIFTAEICAIDLALNLISKSKGEKFQIFSDSLSVLTSLIHKRFENPLIIKLLSRLDLMSGHKEIVMCWILSRFEERGNERVD